MIHIKKLVDNFTGKFPTSPLSGTLVHEPTELSTKAFLSKVQTWLAILDSSKGEEGWKK